MTYADIKTLLQAMFPSVVGGLIATNGGSPTQLELFLRVTNNEICGNPHKFSWRMREYTLTLTGATSYDLRTLIPDLDRVYQVTGSSLANREMPNQSLRDYNLSVGGMRMAIVGDTLKLSDGGLTGSLTIPYYSNYLVKASDGTRKLDFSSDTDVSVIPDSHVMMLVEGVGRFVYRKAKQPQYTKPVQLMDGRVANVDPFMYLLQQAIVADKAIQSSVYDFRYSPV